MSKDTPAQRRSLKYIRLAAFLAAQPRAVDRLVMTLPELEELLGDSLPAAARFPSWWRNDDRRMHSRAWMTAGWEVNEGLADNHRIFFRRTRVAGSRAP